MALRVGVNGIRATCGRISRFEVIKFVADSCQRHDSLRRLRLVSVTFEPRLFYEGDPVGGLQQGNHITLATRTRRGGILNEDFLIMCLAHELYHLSVDKAGLRVSARPIACKDLVVHTEDEKPEELAAKKASLQELARWQSGRLLRYTAEEMNYASLLTKSWASKMGGVR